MFGALQTKKEANKYIISPQKGSQLFVHGIRETTFTRFYTTSDRVSADLCEAVPKNGARKKQPSRKAYSRFSCVSLPETRCLHFWKIAKTPMFS